MEQFEQLLTCAICLDRYRNPKLLPCQHSFCMEPCMDGLVDYVRRQVKCPECRAEHRIPYQGVQAFPTNVTLQRFLELHIEITGELPDPTSGQTMERCGVCSEKSYCALCVHCEKKCCPECKDAHMDILRREITRINSQVRRGLHRLQDALALVEKNTLGLQTNSASVAEEVDEIYRRLSKALKDRTEQLRNELDRYLGTELRGLIQLKENLELEIANIQSNCDLAEAHINENVPWDDAELLDTKELFLRTVEFIRNFEYEAGDYGRRVRFVMAHDPNQLVLHVAGYGELNIKPETGSSGLLGSTSTTLAPPGGSPGLMRSKSDHRLASQYRPPDDDRLTRNRYVPDYEYEAPEYETPRNKSRYRSRFMRHRDGEDSDGDTRATVRFTGTHDPANPREKVLDTEDAARGPLSGIFRLTDSPRVMKKLQEHERAGKRKKEEPVQPQTPPQPKPQVQVRKAPTSVARQVSEDDEISRIKKQNKNVPAQPETVEERPPSSVPVHTSIRETQEREPEEIPRRTPITRRTSADTHAQGTRSASSDSSTGSESSGGSGIRNTGAPFTAEEMKQKYLSKAPPTNTTNSTVSSGPGSLSSSSYREPPTTTTSSTTRPFQSRFLGAGSRVAPPPPPVAQVPAKEEPKKKEDVEEEEDETSSSSEETETETEEESETETRPATTTPAVSQDRQRSESAMARTDIGPLLARSAEARRGSKEDSPSSRYVSPRGSPAQTTTPTTTTSMTTPGGYTSRFVKNDHDIHDLGSNSNNSLENNRLRVVVNDDNKIEKLVTVNATNNNFPKVNNQSDGNSKLDETSSWAKIRDSVNISDLVTNAKSNGEENFLSDSQTNFLNKDDKNDLIIERNKTIVGENVIRNNDQNVFLSSRVSGHGIQGKTSRNIDERIQAKDEKIPENNHQEVKKANNLHNGEINSVTVGHSNSNNSQFSEESEEGTKSHEINENTDDSEDDDENIEDTKLQNGTKIKEIKNGVEDKKNGNIETISENDSNEDIAEIESIEDISEDNNIEDIQESEIKGSEDNGNETSLRQNTSNGIPKIIINQFSSEETKNETHSSESSENEVSGTKLEDTGQHIPERKSKDILLDDNGWVVNEDFWETASITNSSESIPNLSDITLNLSEDTANLSENIPSLVTHNQNFLSTAEESNDRHEESNSSSENPRSRIYRQGSIGKNGWMTSDESDSDNETTASPILPLDDPVKEEINNNVDGSQNSQVEWNFEDEKTILDKNNEKMNSNQIDEMMNGEEGENCFQKTRENEKEDAPERDVSLPMQMVTTVLCVSVLCCSVLINLFL